MNNTHHHLLLGGIEGIQISQLTNNAKAFTLDGRGIDFVIGRHASGSLTGLRHNEAEAGAELGKFPISDGK